MENKLSIEEIKNFIEAETGLKISVKKEALGSSMRGYVTFTTRKTKNGFVDWSYGFSMILKDKYKNENIDIPTFTNKNKISLYIGNKIYGN